MIEITNASRELNKVEQYLMTISPEIISMKDVPDGEKIIVSAVCYFTEKLYGMSESTFVENASEITRSGKKENNND